MNKSATEVVGEVEPRAAVALLRRLVEVARIQRMSRRATREEAQAACRIEGRIEQWLEEEAQAE